VRILLAEDHQLLRQGLRALLSSQPGARVVGEAEDGHAAVSLALDLGPDVVLMDVGLPGLTGDEATRAILSQRPDILVLALTMHDDAQTVDRMLRAGARGFLVKGCDVAELREALDAVTRGEVYLHPSISDVVLSGYLGEGPDTSTALAGLTPRERQIAKLIAEGHTSRQIAARLGVATKTVQNYRSIVLDKLGLRTTAALTRWALRVGLTE
jgi:DNA-binding NarL/FixJ family response regulator